MDTPALFRFSGAAAILGGLLRMLSAMPLPLDQVTLEGLWTVVDVFLTLGLLGVYLSRADRLGYLGFASFVVAIAALSFIGGPDADVFGFSTYQQGAAVLAIALLGLSIAWLRVGARPLSPPLLWFGSVIAAGLLGMAPPLAQYAFPLAGALLGAAFVAAGWDLFKTKAPAR